MIGGRGTNTNMSRFRAACLVPFLYFAVTRLPRARDLIYLIATSWVPAIWLLWRLTNRGIGQSLLQFAAGYLAFIAIYEIGYLINDGWDAKRSDDSRRRLGFKIDPLFVILFAGIRLGIWASIGVWLAWIYSLAWLTGFLILAIAIAQHNLAQSKGLRLASFYELAMLRFMLPIIAALPQSALPATILVASLLYAFPRFLGYMDSKNILTLPQRREPGFGFQLTLSLSPLLLYLSYLLRAAVLAELTAYYLIILGIWWAAALSHVRHRFAKEDRDRIDRESSIGRAPQRSAK